MRYIKCNHCTFLGCYLIPSYQSKSSVPGTKALTTKHLTAIFTSVWLIVKSASAVVRALCGRFFKLILPETTVTRCMALWLGAWQRRYPMSEPASSWGVLHKLFSGFLISPVKHRMLYNSCFFFCFFFSAPDARHCLVFYPYAMSATAESMNKKSQRWHRLGNVRTVPFPSPWSLLRTFPVVSS